MADLEPRWHFWRILGLDASGVPRTSVTWQFRVTHGQREIDTAHFGGADFNGDGYSDLLMAQENSLRIFYGEPSGFRETPWMEEVLEVDPGSSSPPGIGSLQVRDLNGDGFSDFTTTLSLSSPFEATIHRPIVYLGGPNGVRRWAHSYPAPTEPGQHYLEFLFEIGDINRDGFADSLSVTARFGPSLTTVRRSWDFLLSGADQTMRVPTTLTQVNLPEYPYIPTGHDLDGDGHSDLLALGDYGEQFVATTNLSPDELPTVRSYIVYQRIGPSQIDYTYGIELCDMTGDGLPEVHVGHDHVIASLDLAHSEPWRVWPAEGSAITDLTCIIDLAGTGQNGMLVRRNEQVPRLTGPSPAFHTPSSYQLLQGMENSWMLHDLRLDVPVEAPMDLISLNSSNGDVNNDGVGDMHLVRPTRFGTELNLFLGSPEGISWTRMQRLMVTCHKGLCGSPQIVF